MHLTPVRVHALVLLHMRTCVADASIVYLNADLMLFRRGDFNVFDGQILACLPGHGGLCKVSSGR
jgi:hypothetical protein